MKYHLFLFFFLTLTASDFEIAVRLYNQKKYDEAEVLFKKIISTQPEFYQAIEYLGDINLHQKKWLKAKKYYTSLIEKFPLNAEYHFKSVDT